MHGKIIMIDNDKVVCVSLKNKNEKKIKVNENKNQMVKREVIDYKGCFQIILL